jgi:hypothetical protein
MADPTSHVCPHVALMFIGEPTNIRKKIPILFASPVGEPPKQVYNIQYTNNNKHIYNI